jgi:hypothetical protein
MWLESAIVFARSECPEKPSFVGSSQCDKINDDEATFRSCRARGGHRILPLLSLSFVTFYLSLFLSFPAEDFGNPSRVRFGRKKALASS